MGTATRTISLRSSPLACFVASVWSSRTQTSAPRAASTTQSLYWYFSGVIATGAASPCCRYRRWSVKFAKTMRSPSTQ